MRIALQANYNKSKLKRNKKKEEEKNNVKKNQSQFLILIQLKQAFKLIKEQQKSLLRFQKWTRGFKMIRSFKATN